MKKTISRITVVIMILAIMLTLVTAVVACGPKTFDVKFNPNGGHFADNTTEEKTVKVKEGVKLTAEDIASVVATKEHYTFKEWKNGEEVVDITKLEVKENVELKAVWILDTYVVTFNALGGVFADDTTANKVITVNSGEKLTSAQLADVVVTKTDETFIGWSDGTNIVDLSTKTFTADLTLSAQWQDMMRVTFDANGGKLGDDDTRIVKVDKGTKVTEPTAPTTTDSLFTFDGWYHNGSKFNFDTKITYNLTLTAKWTSDYNFDAKNGVINGYTGTATELTVPQTLMGVDVVKVAHSAFKDNSTLTQVTLPETVTTIGESAFENCTALTTIDLGGAKSIGLNAFKDCVSLTSMSGSSGVVYNNAFYNSTKTKLLRVFDVTTFELAKEATSMDNNAFENAVNLTAITVESGNTKFLADGGVLYIKNAVGAENIAKVPAKYSGVVTFRANATDVETNAFAGCTEIEKFVIHEDNTTFVEIDHVIYKGTGNYHTLYVVNRDYSGVVTILGGDETKNISAIKDGAFENSKIAGVRFLNVHASNVTAKMSMFTGMTEDCKFHFLESEKSKINNILSGFGKWSAVADFVNAQGIVWEQAE